MSRLSGALLASPDATTPTHWCTGILEAAGNLVRSDGGFMLLAAETGAAYVGNSPSPRILQEHRVSAQPLDDRWWPPPGSAPSVRRLRDAWPPHELRQSDFHALFLRPNEIVDVLAVAGWVGDTRAGMFVVRFTGAGRFVERDALQLRALAPAFVVAFARACESQRGLPPPEAAHARAGRLRDRFGLTPREVETVLLLEEGRSNREIADRLGVSEHTARHHVEAVLLKMDVTRRAAVASRIREGTVARS